MQFYSSICFVSIVVFGKSLLADVDFAHEIVPILKQHCIECHSGNKREGGLSLNSRESILSGGESGKVIVVGHSDQSEMVDRILSLDNDRRMPPEGKPLTKENADRIRRWIDEGAKWESGFQFVPDAYEPPLKPRRPELPKPVAGRDNPIDRIIDAVRSSDGESLIPLTDDETYLRRVTLDLVGLLPSIEERSAFLNDTNSDKRMRLVESLLKRDIDYAEHWLTFWNDLLRNDYAGTGFITSGRTQISSWLYDSLVTNKPYDQFAQELIAPKSQESAGFANGIRWRGEVSAGQTVEIQFAQSIGQAFLGINLKCASCHDSFIDRWKLEDAYGLAAIYSDRTLELHRCDKPIGKKATPRWIFEELGKIDPELNKSQRLDQLAALMTHRDNGRFTRTIVNRLWHRLMGRGIVHPTDSMQTAPWNEDLIDFLAEYLVDNKYDLKKVLLLIATSHAYQSVSEMRKEASESEKYRFAGPYSKRLTAEQFIDCVWQVTGTAPSQPDATIVRGSPNPDSKSNASVRGKWIWSQANVDKIDHGKSITFKKQFTRSKGDSAISAIITCDNSFVLYLNGKKITEGKNWEAPVLIQVTNTKLGDNEWRIVGTNAGASPNPAALFFEARWIDSQGVLQIVSSDDSWLATESLPGANGKLDKETKWTQAVPVNGSEIWSSRIGKKLEQLVSRGSFENQMVRSSLMKSTFLSRSLGRPNRDQIVSVRPTELTTLEAIDLSNGEELASMIKNGAENLSKQSWNSKKSFIEWLFRYGLSRSPTDPELKTLEESLDDKMSAAAMEDVLWAVIMLPEFQFVD